MELRRLPFLVVAGTAGAAALFSLRTLGFVFWMDAFDVLRDMGGRGPLVVGRYAGGQSFFIRPLWNAAVVGLGSLFGVEPAGYHVASLLLHALSGLGLYLLVRRMAGPAPAATTTAIWTVLCWNAFQVAWVCPLMPELLATPLAMASAVLFWDGLQRSRPALTALSGAAFVLSVLAKESTLTLPLFFGVVAMLAFGLTPLRALDHLRGFALALVLYALLRGFFFGSDSLPVTVSGGGLQGSGAGAVLSSALVVALGYLRQLLFAVVPVPIVSPDAEGAVFTLAALLVVAGLAALAARGPGWEPGARRLALLGAAWWLLLTVPSAVSSHPRTMHQSGMGVAMVLAAALPAAVDALARRRAPLLALSALTAAFLGAHALMNLRVQDRFRPDSPSTLALYAAEYGRGLLHPPRTDFEAALRGHVRGHLARQGCLEGRRVLPRCREKVSYDLNPIFEELKLGRRLRPLLPGEGQSR